MTQISISECIKFGWTTFKKRPGILIGGFVIAMLLSGIVTQVTQPAEGETMDLLAFILLLAGIVVSLLVELGLLTFFLRAHDSVENVSLKDLWNPAPFWRYLGAQILVGIAVVIGLILLIIPGVIVAVAMLFTSYLVVDKKKGPIEALKESVRITKGHRWQLFLFILAITGLNILGFIALLVGLLVTIPVSMLAMAHAYRTLEHNASEVTPVSA